MGDYSPKTCTKCAVLAIQFLTNQSTPKGAWKWAKLARSWAARAGIPEPEIDRLLGDKEWPDAEALYDFLRDFQSQLSVPTGT